MSGDATRRSFSSLALRAKNARASGGKQVGGYGFAGSKIGAAS
jgi:hypothetical protein